MQRVGPQNSPDYGYLDRRLPRKIQVKKAGSGWMAICPAHDDRKQSLCIDKGDNGGIVVFCQATCETKSVLAAVGCTIADIQPVQSKNGYKHHIVATYDYREGSGKPLYQVVRFEPKDFRQRRPDASGGWIWDLKGVDRVLYRLPELMADESNGWVFIPDGEKDVDTGLRATGLPIFRFRTGSLRASQSLRKILWEAMRAGRM